MSEWNIWKAAFDLVTLKNDGDSLEIRGATDHGLDSSFPNFEIFWRYHVVPATNRPANIDFRPNVSTAVSKVGILNHSLFIDLVNAADSLVKIKAGDLGGERFRNCTDVIKSAGDAIQKFTDFSKAIEEDLATALNGQITIWSTSDWNNIWKPSREKIINYRNFLTHMGHPQVMHVKQQDGSHEPYVLHKDFIVRGSFLTWEEQAEIYRTNPEKWAKLVDVCNELNSESILWLNNAYQEVINAMQPYLHSDDYYNLWGWDTLAHGRHVVRSGGAIGAQGPLYIGSYAASGQNYP